MLEQRQKLRVTLVVLLLILLSGTLIYLLTYQPPQKGNEYFTLQPETWVEDRYETETPGDVEINVYKATRADSVVDNGHQDYYVDGTLESFFYTGFYKGNSFDELYAGEKEVIINLTRGKSFAEQQIIAEQNAIMRVGPRLNSNDGVIDSFVLAKEEDGKFVFYIFLDEDWKAKMQYTNIVWGDNFKDRSTMHSRPFDFSNAVNGVYINKIEEDADWNSLKPVKGGLLVGEVNYEVLNRLVNYEEFDETFIMIR